VVLDVRFWLKKNTVVEPRYSWKYGVLLYESQMLPIVSSALRGRL
jgi:hypothetical protein